jgi:hypothetical protein
MGKTCITKKMLAEAPAEVLSIAVDDGFAFTRRAP